MIAMTNELGSISILEDVVAKIAGRSIEQCYGIVGMAAKNMKDGLVHLLKKESLTKGIKLSVEDNKINLELHIIVEYGTNIAAIAESAISTVKYKVEDSVGLPVNTVNVCVDGVRVDA